ncbi:Beta-arabinofuranosyltransferase RAY1 [Vitis vinifera]|uniref:Beta-arabinofuranosyltransferase RAY1 n=1 Tax=Vitis vinifera TaxID=29760 RepID=A0A438J5R7_VITVI|nr:Beta-arabinofuranosyltransferase RAY1 [Vitis vinifera]
MVCPPGKWPKCERYYALLTLRCILGGRVEAPQGIETCWFWRGRLGSVCFPMKIISWNVRGLGSRNKRRMVKDFLRSENPDVVMIQETKKEICDRRFVGSVWTARNKDWVALPASGASGGILIIWDSKNLRREEVVLGSFSISVKFSLDGCGPLWISAVYGPNSPSLRKDFWVEIFDIYGLTYPLWCVGGDFNVIRRSSEKMGGSSLTPSMRDFDSFIRECELLDPPLRNASFTWSNMQESPVCKRLDRFLYSNEWGLLFPQGLQEALIRRTSDHWPIVMDTNPFMWGLTPFRFENMWLQHTNFKENFRDWWSGFQGNGWEGHKFMRRLQYVKAKLKEWNKFSFGELKEKKKSILNDLANFDAIEHEGGLNPDLLSQRASRKGELEELILREEIHWRQKAKVKWVKEGDCNSKFYHKVANGRRNRKYIKELENERGLVLKNAESITEEILHYFEKLYTNPTGESWGVEGLDWSPISEESALRLDSPFTEEEISKAIFQLDRDKAPGPDGFTIVVFQECWDVIKEDLVRVFAEFHRSGIINQSTNASFIVLIPKKRRQILDAVLIANEIVDERRRSGEEGVVFKIDFEKAYDHVKWDFLDHVLEKKGFSPRWRKWMSGRLSSVSYAILVNGSAKGWVKASRGLRQGDPLSPFLFTLVADVLSRMLMRAEERNMMEGFRVGRNRTRVSHLQFADDTIFFSNSREEELQTLKSLLLVFGHISGLKVNLNKSSIYGINLDQAHLSRLAEMLDCKASGWPILYLGLPLGGNPKTCGFWDPVVERISSRLDGWQKTYLSFGGRITFIQSCLTHLPSYFLSLFKIPASVAAKIERLQRDFLWSGVGEGKRDHLVRWDVVCKPKTIGGLGLGNISWRNLALLGKWLWRYPREGSALWHQGFSLITRYVVGNGERIRFWEDLWWGDQPLGTQYPRLFRVVVDKNISISSVLGPSRPFLWNLNFRRNLSDSEIEDLESLMRSLDDLYLSPSVPDARLWPLSSSGLFSVKSFFLALSQSSGSPQNFPSKFVWNSQVPFKVKSFVWLVAHKKVNTNDMLQVRRPYKALSPDICILCMKHGESADHLFLYCSLTIGLWHRLFQLAKMDWVSPRSIYDMMFIKFKGFGNSKRGIVLWQAVSIALIRVVWWERNARIFEDKARNSGFLGTPFFHSMVARSWASTSDISVLTDFETILLPDFISTLSYAHKLDYDWLLFAHLRSVFYFPFRLDEAGKHWLRKDGKRIRTQKMQEFLAQSWQWNCHEGRMLMAWNNRGLPLHTGVLPPFLYGKGLHNHWVINEALSSELRFIFDASWTITSFYLKDLDHWSDWLVEGYNFSNIKNRSWENVGNSHLGALYGSLYFLGVNYSNLVKHFKCDGQNLFVNTAESISYSFEHQSSLRLWKRRILHPRREKKTMECIHAITSLERNMDCSMKHQLDFSSPLYLPFSLESLLSVIADKNKTIVLAVAGYSYKDMLMSWVCRLRSLLITNFVVCALDHDVYQFSILQGLPVFEDPLAPSDISFDDCHFGTKCFQRVTKSKSRLVLQILKLGYNVLMSDVDVYWFKNPLPLLYSFGPAILVAQSDEYKETGPINLPRRLSSGFYFARSDDTTIAGMEKVVKHAASSNLSEQPSFYDSLCGEGGSYRLGDNRCLEPETNLTVHFLDRNLFPNGAYQNLWEKKKWKSVCLKKDCFILHNNWISGRRKKLQRQVLSGLWGYDISSRMCLQSWQKTKSTSYF